jgi:REP element-mobilizing transposase RayT
MKKIRKNTQLNLINLKGAGRPAIHDKAIRHIGRPKFIKPRSLHLTIKVRENKADIKTKRLLKALHHAIKRARLKDLKIIHYSLEHNHVHLLAEANSDKILKTGMQAFGISFSKAINRTKKLNGTVYKHRYHFRRISSSRELKNVLHYIFSNGIKHGRTKSILDPYNSLIAESKLQTLYPSRAKKIWADINRSEFLKLMQIELRSVLTNGKLLFNGLSFQKI